MLSRTRKRYRDCAYTWASLKSNGQRMIDRQKICGFIERPFPFLCLILCNTSRLVVDSIGISMIMASSIRPKRPHCHESVPTTGIQSNSPLSVLLARLAFEIHSELRLIANFTVIIQAMKCDLHCSCICLRVDNGTLLYVTFSINTLASCYKLTVLRFPRSLRPAPLLSTLTAVAFSSPGT